MSTPRNLMLAPLLLASAGDDAHAPVVASPRQPPPLEPRPASPPRPPPPVITQAELDAQRKRARRAARRRREAGFQPAPITTRRLPIPPAGAFCAHTALAECHPPIDGKPGCGHYACPCGIAWDEGAEGHFPGEAVDLHEGDFGPARS